MNAVLGLLAAVIVVYPLWRICAKAGYPGWLAMLALVPLANVALLYFLAFAEWPALRDGGRPRIGR